VFGHEVMSKRAADEDELLEPTKRQVSTNADMHAIWQPLHQADAEGDAACSLRICFPFLNHGRCDRGSACRFRHLPQDHPDAIADRVRTGHVGKLSGVLPPDKVEILAAQAQYAAATNTSSGPICFGWLNTGQCALGDSCRFRHLSQDHPDAVADRMRRGEYHKIPAHANPMVDQNPKVAYGEHRICFPFLNHGRCDKPACNFRHLLAGHPDALADRARNCRSGAAGSGASQMAQLMAQCLGQAPASAAATPSVISVGAGDGPHGVMPPLGHPWVPPSSAGTKASAHTLLAPQELQAAMPAAQKHQESINISAGVSATTSAGVGGALAGLSPVFPRSGAHNPNVAFGEQRIWSTNQIVEPNPKVAYCVQPIWAGFPRPGACASGNAWADSVASGASAIATATDGQAPMPLQVPRTAGQLSATADSCGAACPAMAAATADPATVMGWMWAQYFRGMQANGIAAGSMATDGVAPTAGGMARGGLTAAVDATGQWVGTPLLPVGDPLSSAAAHGETRICFPFLNKGVCDRGSACKFRHLSQDHPDAIADRWRTGHLHKLPGQH